MMVVSSMSSQQNAGRRSCVEVLKSTGGIVYIKSAMVSRDMSESMPVVRLRLADYKAVGIYLK